MEPEPYFVQWDKIKTGSENAIADLDIPDGFPVKKCCIISKNTVNGRNGFSKKQVLEKGTYTFSCYVKVEKCVPDPEKNVPSAVPEFYFLPEIQRKWIW